MSGLIKRILTALALTLSASTLSADDHWENSCNPDETFNCISLSVSYERGRWPFPKDTKRAEALLRPGLDGAADACFFGSRRHCEELISSVGRLDQIAPLEKNRLGALGMVGLERQCNKGDPFACLDRSDSARHLRDLGVLPTASKDELKAEKAYWNELAKAKATVSRQSSARLCSIGDSLACIQRQFYAWILGEDHTFDLARSTFSKVCAQDGKEECAMALALFEDIMRPFPASFSRLNIGIFESGCRIGVGRMCYFSGSTHFFSMLESEDAEAKGKTFLEIGCKLKNADSCGALGNTYLFEWQAMEKKDRQLLERAVTKLSEACNLGGIFDCHQVEHISGS